MITLTRLNHATVVVNSDLIETIENTPDTLIRLTNGQKLIVREEMRQIIEKVRLFRRSIGEAPVDRLAANDQDTQSCSTRADPPQEN